jgi:hypothetical protein
LAGVEAVDVSLERATADIRLRPGNAISLPQVRQIIKDNGFTSKEATVSVAGTLIERGGKPALDVSGTKIVMLIVPDTKHQDVYQKLERQSREKPGQRIDLRGVVESQPDGPDHIVVAAIGGEGP